MNRHHTFATAVTALLAAGCVEPGAPLESPPAAVELGRRYAHDRAFRRAELEASLVNPANTYSQVRLLQYAVDGGWDALPEWVPAVHPLRVQDIGSFDDEGRRARRAPGDSPPAVEWTHASLMAAGQWMYDSYPMAVDGRLGPAVASAQNATAVGLWRDAQGRLGGLVAAEHDTEEGVAWTCATCHTSVDSSGEQRRGGSNYGFDAGALYRLGDRENPVIDAWGAGRVDTSRDATDNPTVITDLRAVRYQPYLHHTATIHNGLVALAIRVETLLIVSQGQRRRPPRDLAFALAYYLWNLSDATVDPPTEGRDLFEANCGRCHHADGTTAGAVDPFEVGTDPTLADAPGRGTGLYRIPTLVGVRDRELLMHDGSVRGLDELFDPQRLPSGAHPFGLELDDAARARLRAFVSEL